MRCFICRLFKCKGEETSPEVASIAARGLKFPETLTIEEIKAVCGSALNQAVDKK